MVVAKWSAQYELWPLHSNRNDQGNVNKTFRYPALVMTDAEDIERWRIAHIFSDASVVITYSWIPFILLFGEH